MVFRCGNNVADLKNCGIEHRFQGTWSLVMKDYNKQLKQLIEFDGWFASLVWTKIQSSENMGELCLPSAAFSRGEVA